jgi:hypothetical protein
MTAAITKGFDVENYVGRVRSSLDDLDDPTRAELTEDLTANLQDLVADRGIDALPQPEHYAAELRAAAGLPSRTTTVRRPRGLAARTEAALDTVRQSVWRTVDSRATRIVWSYVVELRPVWWLVRAQVAFWCWQSAVGGQNAITLTPTHNTLDLLVWTLLVVLSIGAGRVARSHPTLTTRLWLLAANFGAVISLPYFIDRLQSVVIGSS